MIEIRLIPRDEIESIWPDIEQWVIMAIDSNEEFHVDDIKKICLTDHSLHLVYKENELTGFLISVIYDARIKACYASWLGGNNLSEWVAEAFEQFRIYLQKQGVKKYNFIGRKAWNRFLGIHSEQIYYSVPLT